MKIYFITLLITSFTAFSIGAILANVQKLITMESRIFVDLKKYDISTDLKVTKKCSINFHIESQKKFKHKPNAISWCDDIHRFSGLPNTCVVRKFDKIYEGDFQFHGQSHGENFKIIIHNITTFLEDIGVITKISHIRFDKISKGC